MINKEKFLKIAKQCKTPLYIFDRKEAQKNIRNFKNAFKKYGVDLSIFFATKSNYYLGLLSTVVAEGENIDVSSRRELKLALEAGAKRIVYTGPAKTREDFELIIKHHSKVTVNLESLRELELLSEMATTKKVTMRCGVRIYTKMQSGWTKFGIPISDLKEFYDRAKGCESIKFCGVHFHISFNKTPDKYLKTLDELAKYFKKHFRTEERLGFEYIDIGGGFYPETFEGIYSWNLAQETTLANYEQILADIVADKFKPRYLPIKVDPIDIFAQKISATYKSVILPILPNVKLYAEPGRFISHSTMHFLLRIMDVKGANLGITDGGGNMIGWEKYQFCNYTPLYNLSQFDLNREIPFVLYGSLCTPDDIWGYYMFTKGLPKSGDVILMPYQGAYTYTLAQEFIKEIPEVWDME